MGANSSYSEVIGRILFPYTVITWLANPDHQDYRGSVSRVPSDPRLVRCDQSPKSTLSPLEDL